LNKKTLHFTDATKQVQNQVGLCLARENIRATVISHWYSGTEESHKVRFSRYAKMLQLLLWDALDQTSGDIVLVIAEQGSSEDYQAALYADLAKTIELFRKRTGPFRKVTIQLRSAQTNQGLQIADFYAGTVRKMWLEIKMGIEADQSAPYKHVKNQIKLESFVD